MKTALLLVGGYRTFEKTWKLINDNLIASNDAVVFAYCETNYSCEDLRYILEKKFGEEHVGKVVAISSTKNEEYLNLQKFLIKNKPALQKEVFEYASANDQYHWDQSYIKNSGSIYQYYMLMKCFQLMIDYEKEYDINFDIIVKSRFDIVIGKKLDLRNFFSRINLNIINDCQCNDDLYIRSLGSQYIYESYLNGNKLYEPTLRYELYPYTGHSRYINNDNNEDVYKKIIQKINKDNHIWTFYHDQVWIGKRHVFNYLYGMVYFYGSYINPNVSCPFNSETFFTHHLNHLNIKQYMFSTKEDNIFNMRSDLIDSIPGIMEIIR
jgi:hypothetical protein